MCVCTGETNLSTATVTMVKTQVLLGVRLLEADRNVFYGLTGILDFYIIFAFLILSLLGLLFFLFIHDQFNKYHTYLQVDIFILHLYWNMST